MAATDAVDASAQNRHGSGTHPFHLACFHRGMNASAPPTARQVYALAAALCERLGEELPATRAAASELIERLRIENGHPAPCLEHTPSRRGRRRRGRGERDGGDASAAAARLVQEMQ
jgi:hypothetical protein